MFVSVSAPILSTDPRKRVLHQTVFYKTTKRLTDAACFVKNGRMSNLNTFGGRGHFCDIRRVFLRYIVRFQQSMYGCGGNRGPKSLYRVNNPEIVQGTCCYLPHKAKELRMRLFGPSPTCPVFWGI